MNVDSHGEDLFNAVVSTVLWCQQCCGVNSVIVFSSVLDDSMIEQKFILWNCGNWAKGPIEFSSVRHTANNALHNENNAHSH